MHSQIFDWARWSFQQIPPWLLRWRPFAVYEIQLKNASEIDSRSIDEDLSFRWAMTDDQSKCRSLSPSHLFDQIGSGYRALIAERATEDIGIAWFSTPTFTETELGVRFEFGATDIWLFAAHVLAEHRQTGVYSKLLNFAIHEFREAGFERVLLATTHGNIASRRAHERAGAKQLGHVLAARVCSQFCGVRCSGQVKLVSPSIAFGRKGLVRLRA